MSLKRSFGQRYKEIPFYWDIDLNSLLNWWSSCEDFYLQRKKIQNSFKRRLFIIDYNNRFALKIRPFRNKMGHRPGLQSISSIILFSILIYCRGLAKMLLDLTLLK